MSSGTPRLPVGSSYAFAMILSTLAVALSLSAPIESTIPSRVITGQCGESATSAAAAPTTTVIAHGFSLDTKGTWLEAMGNAILARAGGDGAVYRYTGASGVLTRVDGDGGNGSSSNIVIVFNWEEDSGFIEVGPNWRYAQAAGDAMYAMLRDAGYAPGGTGPSDLVSGRVVHLIGHSRGSVVISEAAKRFAVADVAIDQMTTIDPHPVNGTLDARYDLDWGDSVPVRWANVAWADNIWRADGGGIFAGLDFDGIPLPDTFDIELSESVLDCCAYRFSHFDTHLWYFGTVDLSPNPSNGEVEITDTMRNSWWPEGAEVSGFHRSAIGGGDRPTIPPGTDPDPASVPILVNGEFEQGTRAGWDHHGGVGAFLIGAGATWHARLDAGDPVLVHNRMHLPALEPDRRLRIAIDVRRAGSTATDDRLELSMEHSDSGGPQPLPDGTWSVTSLGAQFERRTVLVPVEFEGRTVTFQCRLFDPEASIEASIDFDNAEITIVLAADFDGNGIVNGADLTRLLSDWGSCEQCPSDLDDNGIVDGGDLARLLAAWTG